MSDGLSRHRALWEELSVKVWNQFTSNKIITYVRVVNTLKPNKLLNTCTHWLLTGGEEDLKIIPLSDY